MNTAGRPSCSHQRSCGTDFTSNGGMCSQCSHAGSVQDITFIDTPGVLSGSKQRIGRDYDFAPGSPAKWDPFCAEKAFRFLDARKISAWMADRADLVLLTPRAGLPPGLPPASRFQPRFDAHKLDISDEFQQVMEAQSPEPELT